MLPCTSHVAEKVSFFFFPYLECHFMIATIVRLNLPVLKISETYQEYTKMDSYVSKVAGIHSPI